MNSKIKFAIIGVILSVLLAILILVIINFSSMQPRQMEILKPPPALLKVDGNEQISGIGSYCWDEADKVLGITMSSTSVCADYEGIHTPVEPLRSSSPFAAHLSLPLNEPPQELQLKVIQVTDEDEIIRSFANDRAWHIKEGNYSNLTPERESDINLSLLPGLYVIEVYPRWKEKGSVTYGFLVNVQ
ncbi:hypothetical protein METP2_02726 [Methanosarcinales archaeon]|nr:hypothetical protein METP2_02726 [Methanosarcinales archaeon]